MKGREATIMGSMQASEMREWAGDEAALRWHLQYNHFPPVDLKFIETAKQAIEAGKEGEYERKITVPFEPEKVLTAGTIIKELHLDSFLPDEDSEDWGGRNLPSGTGKHKHKCYQCGEVWEHDDKLFGDVKAHTCGTCGTEEFEKYRGPQSPRKGKK